MKNGSDLFYIARVKAGDVRAFSAIVGGYQQMVFSIVLKIVANREDAEDITQEVFIKVFKSLAQFKEEAEFSTWLYRIAYNTTLSELRKKRLRFSPIEDSIMAENEPDTDASTEDVEVSLQHLDEALKRLPPDDVFLVTLHYMDGQSIENISKITGLSVPNVKVKLHRIRKKLALELNKMKEDERK
ncbi:DNA-directed RNA polymerase sigma-70 factor [Bacteroidia bacterium]|nr:DNA-directed RNA polymerase sigma-70 factor [Bacteroidia bacterium]